MSVNVTLKSVWDDRGIKAAQKSFGSLSGSLGKLAGVITAALSIRALANGLRDAAKAAVEEQKSAALLAQQLQNTVGANDALISSVEGSIRAMSLNAAVADDELRPAFAQLVRATQDADTATTMLQLALDVSAGTGRDLQSVTIALSKAYQGNTTALSRLGIKAEEGKDIFAQLEEQFAGAAETAARNDPFARISVTVGELQEQIGVYLIPLLNGLADQLNTADFGKSFENMAVKIGLAIEAIDKLFISLTGNNTLTVFTDILGGISYEVTKLTIGIDALGKSFGYWLTGKWVEAISFSPAKYIKDQIALLDNEIKNRTATTNGSDRRFSNIVTQSISGATSPGGGGGKSAAEIQAEQFAKVQKVIKKAQAEILKAERDYTRTKFEINRDFEDRVAELRKTAADSQLSLIKDSQARITDAFRSATQLGLGNLFSSETTRQLETQVRQLSERLTVSVTKETEKTAYSSVTEIINGLRDRLSASKTLLANASELAALGFKQTFIEQVLETGTETGNALAGAILEASPETQSELKTLFGELETVSETGADSLAKSIYDKFGLATRELKNQSVTIQQELTAALQAENKILLTNLADAAYAFQTQISDIKTQFLADLDQFNGAFAGLGNTIKGVLGNLQSLLAAGGADIRAALTAPGSGSVLESATVTDSVAIKDIKNSSGIVIDELSDVAGALAYLQARIAAGNAYIKNVGAGSALGMEAQLRVSSFATQLAELQGKAASGTAAGTVVNINVRTDTTQSQAMVGKTIGKIVTKYVTTGGQVLVSGN
jgi:hypothetical protein